MNDGIMRTAEGATVAVSIDGAVCHISGVLDFETARAALDAVVPTIETTDHLDIDLGGVTRSNSAGLALMIEWLATAERAGHTLAFTSVPDGLRQLAGVCQVEEIVGIQA